MTGLGEFVYRQRWMGKAMLSCAGRYLPEQMARAMRAGAEKLAFWITPEYQGETLPPIFHHWSARFVGPRLREHGLSGPEQLYRDRIAAAARRLRRRVVVVSMGSGACDLEIGLSRQLSGEGIDAAFVCVDFNARLLDRARAITGASGQDACFEFIAADCNRPFDVPAADVVVVNQFFHHVEELEVFCATIQKSLRPDGVLLTSDIIGRNGHLPWPAAEARVQRHWKALAAGKRFDRYFGRSTAQYRPMDHAAYSNEGVRAQDVVECLLQRFDFEVFFAFGGAVMPFVERRVGFNFDPGCPEDRDFIATVQAEDELALASGQYPASNMIAVLRHRGEAVPRVAHPYPPQAHAKLVAEQKRALPA